MDSNLLEHYMIRAHRMRSEYIAHLMRERIAALQWIISRIRQAAAHTLRSARASWPA